MILAFHATYEEKKAEFAKNMGIVHLVSAKYDTERRLKEVEEREKLAADTAAELEKVPASKASKEKIPAPQKKNPVDPKATKAAEKKAKEAKAKENARPAAPVQPIPLLLLDHL